VIQAGSAVTVDLVTAPTGEPRQPASLGSFEGGAILPGVPMMLRLLGKGADLLPEIDAAELLGLPPLPGKNTESAMICGAASALVGGVLHLVERYRQQYGQAIPIIISGGDGMRLRSYVPAPLIVKDHLVHRGLLRLAELIT
ncbi:MAG: type III pantothenate kinase, partial [Planctomycetales bacterium]|nr:type III pantothenate kinase [Planctomycetales bacterium]